jgi:hypothetical protein
MVRGSIWLDREQRDVIAFLLEEKRAQGTTGSPTVRLDDDQRRRLAVLGQGLGRGLLLEFATLLTTDTISAATVSWSPRNGPTRGGVRGDLACGRTSSS